MRVIPYAMHKDPPVSPPRPQKNMRIAVHRVTTSGKELGPKRWREQHVDRRTDIFSPGILENGDDTG